MIVALPVIDTENNRGVLASALNVTGSICFYNLNSKSGSWIKTSDLAQNMSELLPALESCSISVIITRQVHPMALKILTNKGFKVYKAKGVDLENNVTFFANNHLELYSHDASMEIATICGGECTSCNRDVCDDDKKSD